MNRMMVLSTLLIVLMSCQQNTKKHYYKTGELKYETYNIGRKGNIFHVNEFYKNGVLKAEGNCKDITEGKNIPIDHWKEYYSDGVLKWEGDYNDAGQRIISKNGKWPDFVHLPAHLAIDGNPDSLKVGYSYKIRILMPSVHPSLYIVSYENFKKIPLNPENPDKYPYIITPQKPGKLYILLVFPNKDGYYIAGSPMLSFELNVEK